jgi:hypothetical protein
MDRVAEQRVAAEMTSLTTLESQTRPGVRSLTQDLWRATVIRHLADSPSRGLCPSAAQLRPGRRVVSNMGAAAVMGFVRQCRTADPPAPSRRLPSSLPLRSHPPAHSAGDHAHWPCRRMVLDSRNGEPQLSAAKRAGTAATRDRWSEQRHRAPHPSRSA